MAKHPSTKVLKRRSASLQPSVVSSAASSLTTLNFKVTQEFHRDFKTFAAQRSKKMVEILQEAFALLKDADGR